MQLNIYTTHTHFYVHTDVSGLYSVDSDYNIMYGQYFLNQAIKD